jgi:hypothetical protein
MPAGRRKRVGPETLHAFAHQFYWDFRGIAEGRLGSELDKELYAQLLDEANSVNTLDDGQVQALVRAVRLEVDQGRLSPENKTARLQELGIENVRVTREYFRDVAARMAQKEVNVVPGKPEVIRGLLDATTAEEVRLICQDAVVPKTYEIQPGVTKEILTPNWPISVQSMLRTYLSQYAEEFIAAKNDKRFPVSNRPTSQLKQLWFLSRALAGALFGEKARTAINLVGSMRPEQAFQESRNAKASRKRQKRVS